VLSEMLTLQDAKDAAETAKEEKEEAEEVVQTFGAGMSSQYKIYF
jgi:hypothetical protein